MTDKQYARRDVVGLDRDGGHYSRHVAAMTTEKLHSKHDIAAELAYRDYKIAALELRFASRTSVLRTAIAFLAADRLCEANEDEDRSVHLGDEREFAFERLKEAVAVLVPPSKVRG